MIPRSPRKSTTLVTPLAVLMLVLASGGCQSLVFLLAGDSGITGQVCIYGCGIIDPSQPPPDCEGRPGPGHFYVRDANCETTVVHVVTSEPDGAFRVSLVPGTYCIPEVGSVVVMPGEYTEVHVGIPVG